MYRIALWKKFVAGIAGSILLLMTLSTGLVQAHPQFGEGTLIFCSPTSFSNNNAAFPYTASMNGTPPQYPGGNCQKTFHWGWTTAGASTGNAVWDGRGSPLGIANTSCTIQVFIPDNHAGALDAQYFIHSGTTYLANVLVNQETHSGWYTLGTWYFSQAPVIILYDSSPGGNSGWQIAAYAMQFLC